MHRLSCSLLVALGCSLPLWAEPLEVNVDKGGEQIRVRLTQSGPFSGIVQRWKTNPDRFEVVVPKAELQGKTVAIDRGILQRIETKNAGESVLIQIYSMSQPKMTWSGSAESKTWTLHISSSVQASAGDIPRLPSAGPAAKPAVASRPRPAAPKPEPPMATKPEPPVTAKPEPPVAAKPEPAKPPVKPEPAKPPVKPEPTKPSVKPDPVKPEPAKPTPAKAEPVANRPKPSEPTAKPEPVAVKPLTPQPPAAERPDQRLISIHFQNKDLPAALRDMAKAAGLEADIGPKVSGKVTASFTATPLSKAVSTVLGKQEALYEYKIVNNRLVVTGDGGEAGATLTASPPTPARSVQMTSDYFTLKPDQSVGSVVDAVRKVAVGAEVYPDMRLNVLYVRGDAADLEKVRNLLKDMLVR